jgi:large subunit ribosomal protein L7/L12
MNRFTFSIPLRFPLLLIVFSPLTDVAFPAGAADAPPSASPANTQKSSANAPSPGTSAEKGPEAHDVFLLEFGEQKIQVIRIIREITGLGLADAKTLVESAPTLVARAIAPADAAQLVEQLSAVGAKAEAKPSTASAEGHAVVLTAIGEQKIQVIKLVREATGLGLADAKNLVERAPVIVKAGFAQADAEKLAQQLVAAGARAEVKAPTK